MNKFLNYISIAILAFTLFSCNKNEWTPEKEAEFKKDLKDSLQIKAKGLASKDQINSMVDCYVEKLKIKGLKPNIDKTPENSKIAKQLSQECYQEVMKSTWNSKTEEFFKTGLKKSYIQNGFKNDEASILTDCIIAKLKEQNISPVDLKKDPKKIIVAKKIVLACEEELEKENN
ncbi:hypothetical protein SAMN06265349_102353 [Flavobacterium resistens]|uniref:Lipoprotein n=1 Tax=Flavobacterium resistens TaxID=443612 RepID=A0A521CBX1_9FLAO|nr:hypothetical protein [Flavobacterium resistens]MRX66456.1 hypothetical protein [Flavobacterium resistens]SMO56301.1 hypothetical protein SAMN06265349_102353 [Flavobacterium resistens]